MTEMECFPLESNNLLDAPCLSKELDWIIDLIKFYPGHESRWYHVRFLSKLQPILLDRILESIEGNQLGGTYATNLISCLHHLYPDKAKQVPAIPPFV